MVIVAHLAVVQTTVCILEKRPDASRGGVLRWSLPYKEICFCQAVVAPKHTKSCPRRKEEYEDGDLWFLDDPYLLIMRQNWKKDILDELMNRTTYCDIRQAPVTVSCPTNQNMEADPGKATAMVVYQNPTATDQSGAKVSVVCYPPSESEFTIGQTTVTCVAGDHSENSVTCDFQVDIKDVEAPVIGSCPADMELETDPDKATAIVIYQTPTATDNSGEVSVVCNPASGYQFPIGQTTATCVAGDSSKNNETCDFVVDIKE
ncbi:hyalin-like [Amphiura filiformis]|uniref:hyalin-like n=1 Tax=Amphiura filiformis TaxID=82378 RepID=UPI003B227FA5